MRSTATGVRTNSPPPHRRPVDPYSRPSDPYSGHDPYQVKSKEPKNNPSSTMWRPSGSAAMYGHSLRRRPRHLACLSTARPRRRPLPPPPSFWSTSI